MRADPMTTLRSRTSWKWVSHPSDVLPMFVAEMDFPLAPGLKSLLHRAIESGDTGYVDPYDQSTPRAFASFAAARWDWRPPVEGMRITGDVSQVIVESLRRLVAPGQSVIVTSPVYPPFYDLVREAGATVLDVPLLGQDDGYALDIDGIDQALAGGARGLLLCNPHNPVGLVHSQADLQELSAVVAHHGGFVISDEIHAPLTHTSARFTPYLSVSAAAREHGITAASASKAFNISGLKGALFVTEGDRMQQLVQQLPAMVSFRAGLWGLACARHAFLEEDEWLDDTVATIESNTELLQALLREHLPQVGFIPPRAGYLAWLDLTALEWGADPSEHALARARVAMSPGLPFGPAGQGHARLNIGCAPETVVEAVRRLAVASGEPRSSVADHLESTPW